MVGSGIEIGLYEKEMAVLMYQLELKTSKVVGMGYQHLGIQKDATAELVVGADGRDKGRPGLILGLASRNRPGA
jgi:hypothetical protein